MSPKAERVDLLQGTLDLLILRTLKGNPNHGHAIARHIQQTSQELLQVETGSLYPALHRLERQKWVSSEWRKSDANQRAKFYRITALGKKQLAADYARWNKMVASIESIMTSTKSATEATS